MANKNQRRISIRITAQTLYHLENMKQFCGYKDLGHVIDKLVREKQIELRGGVQNNARSERKDRRQDR